MATGTKKFKLAFQVAVNPDAKIYKGKQTLSNSVLHSGPGRGRTCTDYYKDETVEWVIADPSKANLRPYGILFKEADD